MVRFTLNLLFSLVLSVFFLPAAAQDSCQLKVSLLTCSPGEELYSIFGHSAFRVQDRATGTDIIFNYGTFDFNDPDFYPKFVRGKLLYYVSTQDYYGFREDYRMEGRGIIEQQLALDCAVSQALYQALQENLRNDNKYYKYDFQYDNCSSRLKDILKKAAGNGLEFKNVTGNPAPTFRMMIHTYLNAAGQYWSKLGIDMLLGNGLDIVPTKEQSMFLPDYLLKGFDSASINGKPIVRSKQSILERAPVIDESANWFRPIIVTTSILLLMGVLQFSRRKWAAGFLKAFDFFFFFLLGCLGCLMLFMWFGTDHKACGNNFNLLWAIPLHLPVSFFVYSKKEWVRKYFMVMAAWYFLLFFAWALLPQDMNSAIVPIVILAFMRSVARFRKLG